MYEGLEMSADDYLGNHLAVLRHFKSHKKLRKPVDPQDWKTYSMIIANAFYHTSENTIAIPSGMLGMVSNDKSLVTIFRS